MIIIIHIKHYNNNNENDNNILAIYICNFNDLKYC